MARPQKHNWEEIRNYYEAGMTQAEISKKFNISKGTLSERIKIDKWVVSEQVTERIDGVISAVKAVSELSESHQKAVTGIIDDKLKKKNLFDNSALANQQLANIIITSITQQIKDEQDIKKRISLGMSAMPVLESHTKITRENKSIVLGKEPDPQMNVTVNTAVQNNIQNISDAELTEMADRYGIILKD